MVVIAVLASASMLADVISPYNPTKTNLLEMLDGPSMAHPMGTDELGRDLMARILHGGRVSLAVGVLAVALAVTIGSTVGAIAGYRGGWVDNLLMRLVDFMIAPNAVGPIIVAATLGISGAILTESSLSYLGLGIQPPVASWGNMLRNAQDQMTRAPWTAVFPGLMIFLTVLAVNYVGDGLRDALDPRKVGSR